MDQFQNGANIDTRPEAEKIKDFKFVEVVASAMPVTWVEKPQSQWRKFPIFNQDGSGSCVAQTRAKELGIIRSLKDNIYVHFSATHIYQRRSNKPGSGMIGADSGNIAKQGVTLEVLVPSQNLSDGGMDEIVIEPYKNEVGKVFAVQNFLELPTQDIDTIASTIQKTGKGVMVWFYFEIAEWTPRPIILNPNLTVNSPTSNRHSVTAVDFTLVNGKKCLIIEDSWGTAFGMVGQRVIDETFFKARNWYSSYLLNFKFDNLEPTPTPAPQHTFNKNLAFSPIFFTDPEVVILQDILKYEGLFPSNSDSTGYYGAITAKAVLAWQKKHAVSSNAELDLLQGKSVGPKTRAKLNQIYG